MALILPEKYPGRADPPSVDYPFGSFKNRSAPNVLDGTFLDKDWTNDQLGFFQSLLSAAGISANGQVDKVGASQYYDALASLFAEKSGNSGEVFKVASPLSANDAANKGYVDGQTPSQSGNAGKVLTTDGSITSWGLPSKLSTASGSAPSYSARAFANVNGITSSIISSGNVSSVTRNGVGDLTINFATPMPSSTYARFIWCSDGSANWLAGREVSSTASSFRFITVSSQGAPTDTSACSVVIYI